MKQQYVLITVSGADHFGITSRLVEIIKQNQALIVDIGQSVTHGFLSLSILLDMAPHKNPKNKKHNNGSQDNHPLLKDLLFEAKKLDLTLEFKAIDDGEIKRPKKSQSYILSCVASKILSPAFFAEVTAILTKSKVNIHRIDNLRPDSFKTLEITTELPVSANAEKVKAQLFQAGNKHKVDMAFLKESIYKRNKRLIVFDMDSTLVRGEVIDELAKLHGVHKEVEKITAQAMNGKIKFDDSLTRRVKKLKGLTEKDMKLLLKKIHFNPGTKKFVKVIKTLGYKTAIISGGFSFFANHVREKLGIDYSFANELEIKDAKLTGRIVGTVINAQQKALLLNLMAQQEGITLDQVVAIGDGANDIPMLTKAGLGIAFHAKEVVRKSTKQQMSFGPMTSILCFLGIPEDY